MIISLSTLIVFVYQTNLIRKQQYMSVYPHLNLSNNNTGSLDYEYTLKNEGVGPAFITSIDVFDGGGKTYMNLVDYVRTKVLRSDSIYFHYFDIYVGKLISSGEEIALFGLLDDAHNDGNELKRNIVLGAHKLRTIINNDSLNVNITYKSIYGESWKITKNSMTPEKL